MHCTNCGTSLREDSRFCSSCGNKTSHEMAQPTSGSGVGSTSASVDQDFGENGQSKESIPFLLNMFPYAAVGVVGIILFAGDISGNSGSSTTAGNSREQVSSTAPPQDPVKHYADIILQSFNSGGVCDTYIQMIRSFADSSEPANIRMMKIDRAIDFADKYRCLLY